MHLRNGVSLILRQSDWFAINQIVRDDVYRIDLLKDPKVILDVGAHIGVFSLIIAKRFPHATVYAIEPETENYQLLVKNISLNKLSNVVPLKVAVTEAYGKAVLNVSDRPDLHSLYFNITSHRTEEVETVPLSHFKNVDVLKIDAEGALYHILDEVPECNYVAFEAMSEVPGVSEQKRLTLIQKFREKMRSFPEKRNVYVFVRDETDT